MSASQKFDRSSAPINRRPLAPAAFSVSARVAMQLGRESIASTNTAVLELVKNAYDADADWVRIRFSNLDTPHASLVIEDNGNGMTEDEIRDHWLCIGTTNKQDSSLSRKNKRVQTGEKGLGRLGLDRLSRRTRLQTKRRVFEDDPQQLRLDLSAAGPRSLELDIDWDRYNARGQRLETIAHEVYELDHLDHDELTGEHVNFEHGTRLILEGLKDEWTKERISELKEDLALTLSPFSDQSDFRITIEAGIEDVDGPVHPNRMLLHLATWRVDAAIEKAEDDQDEEIVWVKLSSRGVINKYELGPIAWAEFTKHSAEKAPKKSHCGPVRMTMHVFIRDSDELGAELSGVGNFLRSNMGVRIYRDGFRVKPYGDPRGTNDWLSLSMRRAQNPAAISRKSWRVAYHQVVGAVLVSRNANPTLVDQTNREGLVEGAALNDLRTFTQKVVSYFEGKAHEDYVAQHPSKPKQSKKTQLGHGFATVEGQLEALAKKTAAQAEGAPNNVELFRDVADEAAKALESLRVAKAETQAEDRAKSDVIDELKDELRLTTSLASLGIMAASFGHERVKDAVAIRSNVGLLKDLMENPSSSIFSKEDQEEALKFLSEGASRIEAFAQFSLDHVRPGKRRGTQSELREVVSTTFRMFKATTDTMRIRVELALPDNPLTVPGWEAGWESVLANLIINSCHFLRQKRAEDRLIRCTVSAEADDEARLVFEDSGIGLEAGTEMDIFRPGFSTRRGSDGLQEGTGLGLALVRSFIDSIEGMITATNSPTLGGAAFVIITPLISTPSEDA